MQSHYLFTVSLIVLAVVFFVLLGKYIVGKQRHWSQFKYELSCLAVATVFVGVMFVLTDSDGDPTVIDDVEVISAENAIPANTEVNSEEIGMTAPDQTEEYEVFYEKVHLRVRAAMDDLNNHLANFEMNDMWVEDSSEYSRQLTNWINAFKDREDIPDHYEHVHAVYLEGVAHIEAALKLLHEIVIEFGDSSEIEKVQTLLEIGEVKIGESEHLYDQVEK
ncbi:hypothetical protein [Alkalihalobacterium elongatum]|uniref:hypothetical protein n=1 Tax=Alkalihalobacterium elongatum TaxID=2675466 RepID=UPI001C1FED80|nr:hypothetical protein [Alkalihalobacterium elongatum]